MGQLAKLFGAAKAPRTLRFKQVSYYEIRSDTEVLGFSYDWDSDFSMRVAHLRGAVGGGRIRVIHVVEREVYCDI